MKITPSIPSFAMLVLAAGISLSPAPAAAVELERLVSGNAVNYCQSSLPVFDGKIRKRPLSVQNEDVAPAYVTCALESQGMVKSINFFLHSSSGIPTTLSCTGVSGRSGDTVQYVVKSINLAGDGGQEALTFEPADFGATGYLPGYGVVGLLCNLQPGMGIDRADIVFMEPSNV